MRIPSVQEWSRKWVDDHLDLYNYAGSLGDTEWQEAIRESLKFRDNYVQQEIRAKLRQDLWKMYDSINLRMLELFEQLRQSKDSTQIETIREQVWVLKSQRIEISKKILAVK